MREKIKWVAGLRTTLVLLGFVVLSFAEILLADGASFQGLGHLPGTLDTSAQAVSGDGSVVVGWSRDEPFRWTAEGGMQGLGYLPDSDYGEAFSVSDDGTTVVGYMSGRDQAFRWTQAGGMQALGGGERASDVSADGSVVVGYTRNDRFGNEPFRWTVSGGMQRLGYLPGGGSETSASAVSADGSVVVGSGYSIFAEDDLAFRWTAEDGMQSLGDGTSWARDVSADGSVVVGTADGLGVFRWTAETGMVGLAPGVAHAVSADGSVILGRNADGPFIWDQQNGVRNLRDMLVNDYGLDLGDWDLREATDISADGLTIVGNGRNPSRYPEPWIATIPEPLRLIGLEITGPDEVLAWSAAQYSALAYYNYGSPKDVTTSAIWSLEPVTYGSIDENGLLTLEGVDESENITISARYTRGEITVEAHKSVLCIPRARPAQTYYVDAAKGDNRNNGLSPETAFATIQKGIDSAEDGDTVLVYPGVYTEEIRFRGKAITVQSAADAAVIENPDDFAVSFYYGEGPDSILKNFVIRNSFTGIFIAASSPTISNVTVVDNKYGIEAYVRAEPNVSSSIFWNNTDGDLFGCQARYSCIEQEGEGNINTEPLFVDPNNDDYHLRSERGRYWPEHDVWVLDEVTSPCIDGGDPTVDPSREPTPNGGRVNMGAYGGTAYASMSEMRWIDGDLNHDGIVNMIDIALLAENWLRLGLNNQTSPQE